MSFRLGAGLAWDALRSRAALLVALLAIALVGGHARLEHARAPAYAADRALLGATFGFVVPLVCYALFALALERRTPLSLFEPLARHGADRRELAFGFFAVIAAAAAALVAALGGVTALSARGWSDPELGADFFTCLWSGASVGVAYAGFFAFASLWGRIGRVVFLVGDFWLGTGGGTLAFPWPRGHARNLLGGEPVLALPQAQALLLLWVMGALGVLAFSRRAAR